MIKLQLLDLFSGIGGFSLGLESTGFFKTIAFVEKDKFCRQVLQKNFNNIPIEEDIRNVRGERYKADIITGGFPCQPFSVAGKRKGTDDDRYLWDETIRVVAECKPRWFIGENVEGIININNGMVLRQVQTDLEEQGFQVQCLVIPASGIGAWHQRKRIWIVAYSDSNRHSNKIRGSSTKEERISQEHRQDHNTTRKSSGASSVWKTNNQHVPNTNTGFSKREDEEIQTGGNATINGSKDVSNSDSKLSNGCGSSTRNSSTKFKGMECNQSWNWNEIRSKAERCSEQTKSRESWWQAQSEFCGVPNGISYELDKDRSSRIKALGNSIVPQIARQLGLAIMKAETE
jgi:DNA (cytosine-5)-methyltransferase 1